MKLPNLFKKKSFWIITVLAVLGGLYLWQRQQAAGKITYETVPVERGILTQTVEVTGAIRPAARIDLAFEAGGTLKNVMVKVGDNVKKGDVLAELVDKDLSFSYRRAEAALAMAQANLKARLAGESDESIRVSAAQLEQAKAAYDKAVSDLAATKIQVQNDLNSAMIALNTAKNNLDNAGPISDQALINAVETSRLTLKNALGPMNTALVDGDAIVGVDDTATNQLYKQYLGALNDGSLEKAKNSYRTAKANKLAAEAMVNSITSGSSKQDIFDSADKMQIAIEFIQAFLLDVKAVLASTITSSSFSSTDLAGKKSTIDADYTSVSTQKNTVVSARQAVNVAELSKVSDRAKLEDAYKSAQVAYETAKTNIDLKIKSAQTAVDIQKAAVDSAQAALDLKKAGPRAVDVAGLRAQVQDAKVAYDQAAQNLTKIRITAPVDGTITDVVSDIGEQITPNTPQVRMIGTEQYDIEAQVPEADIAKIKVGQNAEITLDAYGDEVKFKGTVTAINPDQTKIQDAIYYNIRVQIDTAGKDIKPGMTSNVTIETGRVEDALLIPNRAIKTDSASDQKSVRMLINGKPETRNITVGLKGDEGKIQVISGLTRDDQVILSEKTGR